MCSLSIVKSHWEWRDEFCFPILHNHVEEQRRVMFLQTWPSRSWMLQSALASAVCLTCPHVWNVLARNLLWLMPFPNPSGPFLNWCCRQVSIHLFEVVCCRNTVQDENLVPTFTVSTLVLSLSWSTPPIQNSHIPHWHTMNLFEL